MSAFSRTMDTIRRQPLNPDDPQPFHRALANFNHHRLSPALPDDDFLYRLELEAQMRALEGIFIEIERDAVAPWAAEVPTHSNGFVEWYETLIDLGPGQNDALFPWLAEVASEDEMRWFLTQEVAGEAGFEDLVAITQIKLPVQPKLEMARNYWDEMGRGNAKGMHGPMLGKLADYFGINEGTDQEIVWPSLALGNLMIALAVNRHYAYQSIGALGAIELTAPSRARYVAAGLKRLAVAPKARHYFELHATLDVRHSAAWNREIIAPLVSENPDFAPAIAEGALMRLAAGARCFQFYREHFGLSIPLPVQQAAE